MTCEVCTKGIDAVFRQWSKFVSLVEVFRLSKRYLYDQCTRSKSILLGKLSHVPEAEQCGWVKDRFGLSWQIVPKNMGELMETENQIKAMMGMKKIVIDELKRAR